MSEETIQRYVETIFELEKKSGAQKRIHNKQIAEALEIKEASVTEMLQRLEGENLIDYQPYRGVLLTDKGLELGKKLHRRHRILAGFFKSLGVDSQTAETDACRIEHVVNDETINKLSSFVDFIENTTDFHQTLQHFRHYDSTGEFLCDADS